MAQGAPITYSTIANPSDIAKLKKDLAELRQLSAELKKELKSTKDAMGKNPLGSGKDLENFNKSLNDSVNISEDMLRIQKQTIATKGKLNAARTVEGKELAAVKVELSDLNRAQRAQIKEMKAQEGSMTKLSLTLAKNKKAYRELSKAERENTKIGGKLLKNIQKQDAEIKKLDKSIGDHQRNVGDYAGQIGGLVQQFGGLPPQLNGVINKMSLFTGSLKGLKAAIIGTGIGALVIGLVSLVQYFQRTEEGANKLNKILNYIKIPIEVLLQAMGELGGKMVAAFDDPKQAMSDFAEFLKSQIMNRVAALGSIFGELGGIIKDVFSGEFDNVQTRLTSIVKLTADFATGIENSHEVIADKLNAALDESNSKIKEANELEDRSLSLTQRKRAFVVEEAKLLAEIADARRIANDEELDRTTQARAIAEAESLTNQLARERLAISNEELAIMNQEAAMFDSDAETLDQIAQKEREIFEIQKQQDDTLRSISRRKATINNQLTAQISLEKQVLGDEPTELYDFDAEMEKEQNAAEQTLNLDTELAESNKNLNDTITAQNAAQYEAEKALADQETALKDQKIANASSVAGFMADLVGRETEAGKAFAITQTIIDTYSSASKAYLAAFNPVPTVASPALGAAYAAAAVIGGLARIRAITNVKVPSFFDGTESVGLGDNPKGRDTIPAYLNEGERVVPTEINNMLSGVSNPELPHLVRLGKQTESGMFNRLLNEQMKTNDLLGRWQFVDRKGNVTDLNGNVTKYDA